jgi:glycosyltransferase involved in cell wall biosynthesis
VISVCVPIYNLHEFSQIAIQAVLDNTTDCELIIVDNGSTPPFKPPFSGFIETTLIRNEENLGFPAAVNQAIRAAKGDVIVLLNSDVIVTPKWSDKLLAGLNEFSIVGPVTNFSAGIQGVEPEIYSSTDGLYKSAEQWAENYGDEILEVNFVIGFCVAFRKSLFDEIGEFDESLWPCSGEEVDFCFKARELNHRIGVVLGCYVHHEGSQTLTAMERDGQINYDEICKRNDEHLEKRWGANIWERQSLSGLKTNHNAQGEAIRLNLGSGYIPIQGYINIDNRAEVNPDLLCDVLEGLPFDDNSVDEIRAFDFLEHIPIGQTIQVVSEIWRVLKNGGRFESLTPSTEGRGAFQDPTHVSFWNQNSWLYYSDPLYRNLYGIEANFNIEKIEDILDDPEWMKVIHTYVLATKIGAES